MRSIKSLVWALGCAVGMSVVSTFALTIEALAQNTITPDNTLGSERSSVDSFNPTIDIIEGGAIRGQNLFHSFEEFSIDDGYSAYFIADSDELSNMFARITGSARSDIFGVLGTAQLVNDSLSPASTNLYLINPNGIVFGKNSSLDVGASFSATTASSIEFGGEEFSAINPTIPTSILEISPSAYLFSQVSPSNIESSSTNFKFLADGFSQGLRVPNGENITFLGGGISLDGGGVLAGLHALGGRVDLGSVSSPGRIDVGENGELLFSDTSQRGDIKLANRTQIDVSLNDAGYISLNGNNILLTEGSRLNAGIRSGFGGRESQAGDILLNATQNIEVTEQSRIDNDIDRTAIGRSGNILISSDDLLISDGSQLSVGVFGVGDAGNIVIDSQGSVVLNGTSSDGQFPSAALSSIEAGAVGDGGDIKVSANTLEVRNGARLSASTFGEGDSGDVLIDVEDNILFIGTSFDNPDLVRNDNATQLFSAAGSSVQAGGAGDGGILRIEANTVTNGTDLG